MKPSFASFKNVRENKRNTKRIHPLAIRIGWVGCAFLFSVIANASVDLIRVPDPSPAQNEHPFARVGDTIYFKIASGDLKPTRVAPQKVEGKPEFDSLQAGYKVVEVPNAEGLVGITLLKPGTLEVSALELFEDEKRLETTNPLTIKVESAIDPSDQKPKEPEPPLPPISTPFPIVLALLVALAIVALALIGYLIYRKWKAPKKELILPEIPASSPLPEHEVALTELQSLESQHLEQKGDFKRLYFGISEIMKRYLGARFGFDAEESTSRELFEKLEGYHLSPSTVGSVRELFRLLDIVKFTDQTPSLNEPGELFAKAREIIQNTKRAAAPPSSIAPHDGGAKP